MRSLLVSVAALIAGLAVAGAASAQAQGTYFIYNQTGVKLTREANTFAADTRFPLEIDVGQTATGEVTQTNGRSVHTGSFTYVDSNKMGCIFTTTMILSSKGVWSFRFTATPYGENTTAVCTFEPTSTNASTGRYYADAKVSGL